MFEVSKIMYSLQGIQWYQSQPDTSIFSGQKVNSKIFFLIFWNLVGNFEGYPCTILVELEGCLFSII